MRFTINTKGNIDADAFLLSAGFGTRMGKIGEILPKPLWPFFETTLLEYHIDHCEYLGFKRVFINLHFHYEEMKSYIENIAVSKNIEIIPVYEKEILGSGGAFFNLKKTDSSIKKVVSFNIDTIIDFDEEDFLQEIEGPENFIFRVNLQGKYNEVLVRDDRSFNGILKGQEGVVSTYSGISSIDLSQIEDCIGASSFFDTVCFSEGNFLVKDLKNGNLIDLGERDKFYKNSLKIISKEGSIDVREKLVRVGAILESKINGSCYGAIGKNVLNFSGDLLEGEHSDILVLGKSSKSTIKSKSVIFNEHVDRLEV